jgi:hypothetical protein
MLYNTFADLTMPPFDVSGQYRGGDLADDARNGIVMVVAVSLDITAAAKSDRAAAWRMGVFAWRCWSPEERDL